MAEEALHFVQRSALAESSGGEGAAEAVRADLVCGRKVGCQRQPTHQREYVGLA
jgi:hypothetical protein